MGNPGKMGPRNSKVTVISDADAKTDACELG